MQLLRLTAKKLKKDDGDVIYVFTVALQLDNIKDTCRRGKGTNHYSKHVVITTDSNLFEIGPETKVK